MFEVREIPEYEGLYAATNDGRIFSIKKGKEIQQKKTRLQNAGYLIVDLFKLNVQKTVLVHRLIAQAFCENPKEKPHVNHINGNKIDNHYSNLEWCTMSENQLHALKIGLRKTIPVAQYSYRSGKLINVYDSIKEAAQNTGTSKARISECLRGKFKQSNGFKWMAV